LILSTEHAMIIIWWCITVFVWSGRSR